jgi:adenylate cyclase
VPSTPISVLFADVSGSTRLYEVHGDDAARTTIALCIEVLVGVMARHHGRLVKTIGDEIMSVFPSPGAAVLAANEMQREVRRAGEAGRFITGPISIKIGLHLGPGVERGGDVFGEAPILAQQIIQQAKADQILTSADTVQALPPELRFGARALEDMAAQGRDAPLELVELVWEVNDVTQMADTQAIRRLPTHTRLRLRYRGQEVELGDARPRLSVGRTAQNDLVVPTQLASRSHAEFEYRRGRFHLRDMSSNGTVVVSEDGDASLVRGETVQLHGRGVLCLGGTPQANPEGVVDYECE